jgi:hypothetical protein
MSLNDLSLNPHLLTQLYSHSLLETDEQAVPAKRNTPVAITQPAKEKIETPPVVQVAATPPVAEIEIQAAQKTPAPAPPPFVAEQPVAYGNTPSLGGNKKEVLILVKNDTVPFLPDSDLEFLSAILSACRLSIADVAIVNLHHYPQPYTALLEQFATKQVLLMGVTPQEVDLPFHFPHFQLQPFDSRTYLSAYPLRQMAQDRSLKMQLWGCLKQLFGV